jgi:hypothetical protein
MRDTPEIPTTSFTQTPLICLIQTDNGQSTMGILADLCKLRALRCDVDVLSRPTLCLTFHSPNQSIHLS